MVLELLDVRSLRAMLFVNRSFHELIHSERGQIGLWLPLLSRFSNHKDTQETQHVYAQWESDKNDWKTRFVEALKIPLFNPAQEGHAEGITVNLHTATMQGRGQGYFAARAIKSILPVSLYYFEGVAPPPTNAYFSTETKSCPPVLIHKNNGNVMVGVMADKQKNNFSIPTHNFYHGVCLRYEHFWRLQEPHIGVFVFSEKDKVTLHYFLNGQYTHSEKLLPAIYYPAITMGSSNESVSFVRPTSMPTIPNGAELNWPLHPFLEEPYLE